MNAARKFVRANPGPVLATTLVALTIIQFLTGEEFFTRFSVFMTFFVFAFKSWVNLVFSVTTHKQRGETLLSISMERYFWALLAQSIVFSVLFAMSFVDMMGWNIPGLDWIPVRNFIRSIGITAVVAVIIYGDAALNDLRDYFQQMTDRHGVQHELP